MSDRKFKKTNIVFLCALTTPMVYPPTLHMHANSHQYMEHDTFSFFFSHQKFMKVCRSSWQNWQNICQNELISNPPATLALLGQNNYEIALEIW
jgi:hypothetical protein